MPEALRVINEICGNVYYSQRSSLMKLGKRKLFWLKNRKTIPNWIQMCRIFLVHHYHLLELIHQWKLLPYHPHKPSQPDKKVSELEEKKMMCSENYFFFTHLWWRKHHFISLFLLEEANPLHVIEIFQTKREKI